MTPPADHNPMDRSSLHDRAREVVDVLLSVPEERREQAAGLMCAANSDLLALVMEAISAATQDELLQRLRVERTTTGGATETGANPSTQMFAHDEQPGATIGAYKLLERLGEGGFGVVYAAEQAGAIRRRVALKVIKEGKDSRAVVARFEAERQALALMDHPNIAKVFDAGATNGGRPYFVMELVRGVSITEYCEENRLSPRERIELMIPVCQAIQHAHQKGVIHRDIKPGNVLVSIIDGCAVPKVIDFGIAKAIAGSSTLTDKTIYTAFRQFIGTPAYMSPEQILQSGNDVDTRSDVYALGVLMYELLSGSLPFDTESLLKEGLERMQQVVREQDPPKPSTRVMTMDAGKRTSIAAARRLLPDKLTGVLRGEVDWMVMKAVEKDRQRRYQSPAEFAEDLERFLRGEAVRAGPPSGIYRVKKFLRQNRVSAALAGVALTGLIATAVGTSIGLRREAAQRAVAVENERIAKENEALAKAEEEKAKANEEATQSALRFMGDVFGGADPARNEGRRDITVGEMLDKAVAWADGGRDENGSKLSPKVEAGVRQSISRTYNGIGRFEDGLVQARKALTLVESIYGAQSLAAFDAQGPVAQGLWDTGKPVELEQVARRQLELIDTLGLQNTLRHAIALQYLNLSYHGRGMAAECLETNLTALKMLEAMKPQSPVRIRRTLHEVAINQHILGRTAEALPHITRCISMIEASGQELDLVRPLALYGNCLMDLDRLEEAEAACRRSMEITDRLRGPDHPGPTYERLALIRVLILRGKVDEAAARFEHLTRLPAPMRETVAQQIPFMKALLLRAQGHPEQAIAMYQELERSAIAAGWDPERNPAPIEVVTEALGAYNDAGQSEHVLREGPAHLRRGRKQLGTDPANTVLRPLAAEVLRACLQIQSEDARSIASELRAQYPGLEPAQPLPRTSR